MKVRLQYPTHTRFYYADVMVVCEPGTGPEHFVDNPTVVVEVLSPSTRRTDETEKRDAYFTIVTLRVYILLEQERPAAVVWRRQSDRFAREVYEGLEAVIPLPEIEARLPLAEAYEAVRFA
jgi:Uma2 family endonuclease